MNEILELLKHKKQIILQGAPGTGKTRLAKELAYEMIYNKELSNSSSQRIQQLSELQSFKQFNIVQFHPSYSYEDFVRGIEVNSQEDKITYKTKNKTLTKFTTKALNDFAITQKFHDNIENEWTKYFDQYYNKVKNNLPYQIVNGDYIKQAGPKDSFKKNESSFDVKDHRDKNCGYVTYDDLEIVFFQKLHPTKGKDRALSFNGTEYITKVVCDDLINTIPPKDKEHFHFKNYVLIIDEINRANLPSVLGELIYALEYRGEPVESMYEIEGEGNQIVIPDNLYIIGTMNTADRSVGHIDYAIRRRFAFVDVLPTTEPLHPFAEELFFKVAGLFIKNPTEVVWQAPLFEPSDYLSPEFRPEDVMIGHSYFITSEDNEKGKQELDQRFRYEILPILKEYLKDGVLLPDAENEIKEIHATITQ